MLMEKLQQLVVQQKLNVFILIIGCIQLCQKKKFYKQSVDLSFHLIQSFSILCILGPKFLHIYLTTPNEILERIVPNADKNGYRAIVVTCDHPTDRVRDDVLPLFEEASKSDDSELMKSMPMPNMNLPDIVVKQNFSTGSITWANIQLLRKLTKLPIICKGILSPIDAELAVEYGANGIIVRFVFTHI
jgi:isopentenyl diphosphate isomerase/L-lactate dehydrogenase-like FMN-dependent dehydrogenase